MREPRGPVRVRYSAAGVATPARFPVHSRPYGPRHPARTRGPSRPARAPVGEVSPAARDPATVVERVRVPPPTRRPGPTGRGAAFRARRFRVRIPGAAREEGVRSVEERRWKRRTRRERRGRVRIPGLPRRSRTRASRDVARGVAPASPVGLVVRTPASRSGDHRFDSGTGYARAADARRPDVTARLGRAGWLVGLVGPGRLVLTQEDIGSNPIRAAWCSSPRWSSG